MAEFDAIFVDHTTQPGGAELALVRYAATTNLDLRIVFLEPGAIADQVGMSTPVSVPSTKISIPRQMSYLWRELRSHPANVVVSNTLRAAVFVAITKPRTVRHVMMLHDGLDKKSLSWPKRSLIATLVLPRVVAVPTNSEWTRSTIPRRFARVPSPVVYSLSGDPKGVTETPAAPPLRLLSLSRLVHWKGVHLLLEAIAMLPSHIPDDALEVTVAGSPVMGNDSYPLELVRLADQSRFKVTFTGQVDDVSSLLHQHNVLAICSMRPEPFGQVVVQGMAHGLCVIAPRSGGPNEIVRDEVDGLLFEPGDSKAIAEALVRLIEDRDLREQLASSARRRAKDFSDGNVSKLIDDVLGNLQGTGRTS